MRAVKRAASDVRFVGRIPGRYTFPDYRASSGLETFACRTQGITPTNAALSAPVAAELGEKVYANFDYIGVVHGYVSRFTEDGFTMDFDPKSNNPGKLAERINWIKNMKTLGVIDSRKHRRVLPRNPHAQLVLSDGALVNCFVIDMSASGAAVSADYHPPLETPLAIGSVVGTVVRYLETGFAVKFSSSHSLETLEKLLTTLPVKQDMLAVRFG